jgi:hypothetical protein
MIQLQELLFSKELVKKLLFHVPGTVAIQSGDNVMLQVKEILF